MRGRPSSAIFRLVLAAMLVWGATLAPAGISPSHDVLARAAIEGARHAELALERAEHGHTHEDGAEDERSPGHTHGHNSADHSHETPATPTLRVTLHPQAPDEWPAWMLEQAPPSVGTRLERPPRQA